MNVARLTSPIVWLLMFAVASTASGDDGWSLSSLNPFKNRQNGRVTKRPRTDTEAGPMIPKLPIPKLELPKMDLRPKWSFLPGGDRLSEPTAWDKMNSGTRSFFGKAKQVLTPWNLDSETAPPPRRATGRRTIYNASSKNKAGAGKSWFPSWFQSQEEEAPPKPQTVNDFLSLPRPY